ncbi:MAG: biosynthetic peptidoglycan transglycosylase [Nocardioidaceae bacterium]
MPGATEPPSSQALVPPRRRRRGFRRVLAGVLALVLAAALGGALLYVATPPVTDAAARVSTLAARDGASHLAAPVPRSFARSLIASEDARFYSEPGVDPIGVARAVWLSLTARGVDPGGSTISQQLAKQLYTNGHTGVRAELEQVALAVKLNLADSKQQILRMYAATVYFGHGFYGLHNASCGYYGVPPRSMTLGQASVLAGLVQAPSAYDPLTHLGLARSRQEYVLSRLAATGKISAARARAIANAPLHLRRPGGPTSC